MRNRAILDNTLVSRAVEALEARLPRGWRVALRRQPRTEARRADALIELRAPDGSTAAVVLEARSRLEPRDLPLVLDQLRQAARGERVVFLAVAPFLSPRTRERLTQAGLSYLDLTGNVRIVSARPALFIETSGASENPWREERPARSLKGPKAGRIVRALCDFFPPIGVRALAGRTRTDPGYVSRVLALLDREALITREPRGPVVGVDWQGLIRRWAQEYSPLRPRSAVASPLGAGELRLYLEPRGLPAFLDKLRGSTLRYAVTGSLGAARVAPVAPPRLAVCYVDEPERAAGRLGLRPDGSGANVTLAVPFDRVVYERTWQRDGVTFAALSQIAADLLTSPGRGPAEADALLEWMAAHETAWRRRS